MKTVIAVAVVVVACLDDLVNMLNFKSLPLKATEI